MKNIGSNDVISKSDHEASPTGKVSKQLNEILPQSHHYQIDYGSAFHAKYLKCKDELGHGKWKPLQQYLNFYNLFEYALRISHLIRCIFNSL